MTALVIYLLYLASFINKLSIFIFIIGLVACGVIGVAVIVEERIDFLIKGKKYLIIWMIINSILFLVPNKQTIIAMYTIPPVIEQINKKEAIKIPNNVLKLINTWLEKNAK